MFLHLGADWVVSLNRVIAIFDLRSVREAESTREFLAHAQAKRRTVSIADGEVKSAVLTDGELYLSPISSLTLKKRADFLTSSLVTDLGE